MREKLQSIQILRGVAVIGVVLFHLFLIEQKYSPTEFFLPELLRFGMFGVDLFFVISGFVMVMVTREKFQNFRQAFLFLYHRVSRIYPLYWIFSLLVLLVFLIQPGWVNNSYATEPNVLLSFLLLPSNSPPLLAVGWTLIHEMYFYLVFFFILLLIKETFLPKALLLWGAVVILSQLFLNFTSPLLQLASHPLTLEFISGALLAVYYYKTKPRLHSRKFLLPISITGLLLAVFSFQYYSEITGEIEPLGWWRILLFGMPALLVFYCSINSAGRTSLLSKALAHIGDASYSIYLSHVLSLSVIGRLWAQFSSPGIIDNVIAISIALAAALAIGFASYYFIELPILRKTRKIS